MSFLKLLVEFGSYLHFSDRAKLATIHLSRAEPSTCRFLFADR